MYHGKQSEPHKPGHERRTHKQQTDKIDKAAEMVSPSNPMKSSDFRGGDISTTSNSLRSKARTCM